LCLKIPLNHEFQEYLAVHSEGCTPAQIQEIIYGMVIQNSGDRDGYGFKPEEIDYAISRFENKSRNRIGFCTSDTKPDQKK